MISLAFETVYVCGFTVYRTHKKYKSGIQPHKHLTRKWFPFQYSERAYLYTFAKQSSCKFVPLCILQVPYCVSNQCLASYTGHALFIELL